MGQSRLAMVCAIAAAAVLAGVLLMSAFSGPAPETEENAGAARKDPVPRGLPEGPALPGGKSPIAGGDPPADMPADLEEMVFVPAGEFVMGSDTDKPFEKPKRKVWVNAFYVDKYEVTNYEYRLFTVETGRPAPPHWVDGMYEDGSAMLPVVNVTWEEALEFARWEGKRLPTEAEWEKACRGTEGRLYAYGDEFDETRTNFGGSGQFGPVAVYEFPDNESPYGVRQMTGNVWEWVSDWFAASYGKEGQKNPQGPAAGSMRISKGGSWTTDSDSCRASYKCRSLPGARWGYCGFRCARSAPDKTPGPAGKEGMTLVPSGWFIMGSDGHAYAKPARRVWLDDYYIDTYPVTNAEYQAFCDATRRAPPPHWHAGRHPEGEGEHPVVNVSAGEARLYASWAGKRLPTEAEWEKAARGDDGREYPWGNEFDSGRCNTEESRIGHTVPVGSYPGGASPYGVQDMSGNVWQWVEGRFDAGYYEVMPEKNPKGSENGRLLTLRGGTWSTFADNCKTYSRCPALEGCRWGYCGFRCAKDAD